MTNVTALGLMSGTSLDGVDAALVTTDGAGFIACGPALTVPYPPALRERLRAVLGKKPGDAPAQIAQLAADITRFHAEAVARLLHGTKTDPAAVAIIGFHGHTILHRPAERLTVQIGDGALLAELTGIDVVNDFRAQDVAAGGQGAPLVPLFHAAMAAKFERPIAVLNLGGVGNVTWINDHPLAFDTGPGNALIDDWMRAQAGSDFDAGGELAAKGQADEGVLARLLDHPYFARTPPKSLDRNEFGMDAVAGLTVADGAATLVAFTARSVARAFGHFPGPPRRLLVSGGGRHNRAVMAALKAALPCPVESVDEAGWNGDAIEAQAFAYFAVRSRLGLPITLPSTTGVAAPQTGGVFHPAPKRRGAARRADI